MIDQKQLENVQYFNYLGGMITNNERCTREVKYRIAMAKAAFNKKKTFHQQIGLQFYRKKLVQCYIWYIAFYDAEILTPRTVDQKCLESFEM